MQFKEGDIFTGKVTGITNFGVFVAFGERQSGLVHISEIANTYVKDIREYLSIGQEVRVKLLSITPEGRVNLSIKKAQEPTAAQPMRSAAAERKPSRPRIGKTAGAANAERVYVPERSADQNFEDKLSAFMQESNKKMSGSRLYENQKKGGRRRK